MPGLKNRQYDDVLPLVCIHERQGDGRRRRQHWCHIRWMDLRGVLADPCAVGSHGGIRRDRRQAQARVDYPVTPRGELNPDLRFNGRGDLVRRGDSQGGYP